MEESRVGRKGPDPNKLTVTLDASEPVCGPLNTNVIVSFQGHIYTPKPIKRVSIELKVGPSIFFKRYTAKNFVSELHPDTFSHRVFHARYRFRWSFALLSPDVPPLDQDADVNDVAMCVTRYGQRMNDIEGFCLGNIQVIVPARTTYCTGP